MVSARFWALDGKVAVVDTERSVKPINFGSDQRFRDEAVAGDDLDDLSQVSVLASKLDL